MTLPLKHHLEVFGPSPTQLDPNTVLAKTSPQPMALFTLTSTPTAVTSSHYPPEDAWFASLPQLSVWINANTAKAQAKFVGHESMKDLTVTMRNGDGFGEIKLHRGFLLPI